MPIPRNIQRGDFVILKRYLNPKGEVTKKARLGNVRNIDGRGADVLWANKSDKRQSHRRKTHTPEDLHIIDGDTARKVSQYLHKHIATPPSIVPPVVDVPTTTEQ